MLWADYATVLGMVVGDAGAGVRSLYQTLQVYEKRGNGQNILKNFYNFV